MRSRKKPKSRAALVCLTAVALLSQLGLAHEQKAALTDILYNERTGNLEIAHRISLHDAEHSLYRATGLNADLIQSAEARTAFAKYAATRFELNTENKTALPLTLVGQEIEDGYLWVYQETAIPDPVDRSFYVENRILHDVVNGQVNTVNLRYRSNVATLVFEPDSGRQLFRGWAIELQKP